MIPLLGVDTSAHQADLPDAALDRLAAHGCGFLFTRASRGVEYADPTLERFIAAAIERDWLTGAFHFMERPGWKGSDGVNGGPGWLQAERYLRAIDPVPWRIDAHVLDVERAGITWLQLVEFVERLRREGLRVGLYSRPGYMEERFAGQPWPGLFDFAWWAIWDHDRHIQKWDLEPHASHSSGLVQYGHISVPVDGVTYKPDGNLWHGTREALQEYLRGR